MDIYIYMCVYICIGARLEEAACYYDEFVA